MHSSLRILPQNYYAGFLLFCPRDMRETMRFMQEVPLVKKMLQGNKSATVQVTHLPENSDSLSVAVSSLVQGGIDPKQIVPHISVAARGFESPDLFRDFAELGVRRFFLISGIKVAGSQMLTRVPPGEYYDPRTNREFIEVIREMREAIPDVKLRFSAYPQGHTLGHEMMYPERISEVKFDARGKRHIVSRAEENLRRVEMENFMQRLVAICETLEIEPENLPDLVEFLVFQHRFTEEGIEEYNAELAKRGINLPQIQTIMNLGNGRVAFHFSNKNLVNFTPEFFDIIENLRANESSREESARIVKEVANPATVDLIMRMHRSSPNLKFMFYAGGATENLPSLIEGVFGPDIFKERSDDVEERPKAEIEPSSFSSPTPLGGRHNSGLVPPVC